MLGVEGCTGPSSDYLTTRPVCCPSCGQSMHLARSTPRSGLPDLQTFKCTECAVWLSESADAPVWRETRLLTARRSDFPFRNSRR
jgi:transposase-like protein